jgi:hypothetical protein
MSESSQSMKGISGAIGFLEKSIEIKFFLLLNAFILTLDSCLVFFYEKNIFSSFRSWADVEVSIANVLVFLVIFSFMMSILFMVVRHVFQVIVHYFDVRFFGYDKEDNRPIKDFKSTFIAEEIALKERDKMAYEVINSHKHQNKEVESTLTIGFGVVILFVFNYYVFGSDSIMTITQQASLMLDKDYGFVVNRVVNLFFGIYVIGLILIVYASLRPYKTEYVHLPDKVKESAD